MTKKRASGTAWVVAGTAVMLLTLPSTPAASHEIPLDVVVQSFVKPQDGRLRVFVRVPLTSMRDVEFPLYGPGYVDLPGARRLLRDQAQLWITDYVRFFEEGTPLPEEEIIRIRISLPSDPSFRSYETALAHFRAPLLPDDTELILEQALLDVWFEVPVESVESRFSIEPEWAHLGLQTATVLRYVTPGGDERVFQYEGAPGIVRLDPRWHQAAFRFVEIGFFHILEGIDHILFLLCLVIPFRRFVGLVPVVTAFTVAHSITLIASALGMAPSALWFTPLIETLIAASIVYMAFENIVGARLQRRWLITFVFGLVHGFGFSFLLRETLQFAGSHLLTSLLAFNVGVELGQLFFLVLAIPVLNWLFRHANERMGTAILSALVAHTSWHWMTDRGAALLQYDFQAPVMDAALLAVALRWLMLLLVLGGTLWLLWLLFGQWTGQAGTTTSQETKGRAIATAKN